MSLRIKAVAAALLLSHMPAFVSAQSAGIGHTGPGSWQQGVIGAPIVTDPVYGGITPGQQIGTPAQAHDCGAAHAQILVGRSIHNTPVPAGARVIAPGTAVTFDYDTSRMNVALDDHGTITRVYCG